MKIGILTQPLRANYGGLLQNYALQQTLLRLGHTPITLDQKMRELPRWHILLGRLKGWVVYIIDPQRNKKPQYYLSQEEDKKIRKYCIYFIEKYISHTEPCSGSLYFLNLSQVNNLEGFVVGSDQCWRPCYNMYIADMFLGFCKDLKVKKRIAYAVSFGSDNWEFSKDQTEVCLQLAKLFDLITVREDSGIGLCKDYLGVDAKHVLDPTMLLCREDYIALIKENHEPVSDGKLFNYILDPTDALTLFVRKISTETGYKSFQVLPKCNEDHRKRKDVKHRIEDCVYPSPITWLRAFMDAEMTIVDSFHGTVFSIIFNKPFWVIGNKKRGLSRFYSILHMFNLEDRMLSENQLNQINYMKPIDWDNVNRILKIKKLESLAILKNSLE